MLEGCGYLAYTHLPYPPRTAVVLSDPVAAEAGSGGETEDSGGGGESAGEASGHTSVDGAGEAAGGTTSRGGGWRRLVVAFLEKHPRAIFVQVSERFGGLLRCVWPGMCDSRTHSSFRLESQTGPKSLSPPFSPAFLPAVSWVFWSMHTEARRRSTPPPSVTPDTQRGH